MEDDGPCCPAAATRRSSKIWLGGNLVGVVEMDRIVGEVRQMGIEEDETIADALVERARVYNYIPPQAVDDYKEGLLNEYRKRHPSEAK